MCRFVTGAIFVNWPIVNDAVAIKYGGGFPRLQIVAHRFDNSINVIWSNFEFDVLRHKFIFLVCFIECRCLEQKHTIARFDRDFELVQELSSFARWNSYGSLAAW
jgi:hypothetical protein